MKARMPIKKTELAILVSIAVLVLLFWWFQRSQGKDQATARVFVGSEEVLTIPLARESHHREIDLLEYGVPATLEIAGNQIRFVRVICPDHICEKTGWIGADGQSALCMPNRTAVVIQG